MSTPSTSSTAMKFSLLRTFSNNEEENAQARDGFFEEMADVLSDYDLADGIFLAILQGNHYVARRLIEYRGPVSLEYVNCRPNIVKHRLNGEDVNPANAKALSNLRSPADLKAVLELVNEFGLKGLAEPGLTYPALFRKIDQNLVVQEFKQDRFAGELPELSKGVLHAPELAIALDIEASRNTNPGAYRPMLCWATQEMVDEFPGGLSPLRPFQYVSSPTFQGSLEEWRSPDENSSTLMFTELVVGVEPSAGARFGEWLMAPMCPPEAQYGFDDPHGRVLCETTTDFLLQFDMTGTQVENERAATEFAGKYLPIQIMATQIAQACIRDFAHADPQYNFERVYATSMEGSFNSLFELLSEDNPLREKALAMMTPAQWKTLFGKTDSMRLTAKALVAMHQSFGLDNTGLNLGIDCRDIPTLKAGGYHFSEDTVFFSDRNKFDSYVRDHRIDRSLGKPTAVYGYLNKSFLLDPVMDEMSPEERLHEMTRYSSDILSLNLWPSESKKPEALLDVLKATVRTNLNDSNDMRALALRAMMSDAGIEACVEAATTPTHWDKMREVFSRDELLSYRDVMPAKAKGWLIEDDLGI
ncbi:hypothetical protein [Pseudomonas putida]|uniref:Uncharacterized protein n=1 Tax=Pseudomonas putida TaxID=303 RepID=A0A8I1EGW2_PSEPU|nr:hypothetical protein [Pseudomonas putida]MBI6885867.1 hypothetical protein [Pseudomonas putida]